jgi:integrase
LLERTSGPIAEWDARENRQTAPLTEERSAIRIEAETWTVQYTDEHGQTKRVASRCADHDAAVELARELEPKAMLRRRGLIDPVQERHAEARQKPIAEHVASYVEFLSAGERTPKHVKSMEGYLKDVFARAGIERLSDLRNTSVMSAVAGMRQGLPVGERKRKPSSLATCNAALRAVKGFSRWLWRQRLTAEDSLVGLELFNAQTDRGHIRREMTADEVKRLLDSAERRTLPQRVAPGPVRAWAYRIAAATGFRANELRSLTTDSFDLDAAPPTVTVEAGYSKRRRRDVQPLPVALTEPLQKWLAGFGSGDHVFKAIPGGTARMLRADLEAARGEWLEEAGEDKAERARREESDFLQYENRLGHVADFHSLRVLFISRVVAGGARVNEAQTLARHSTPELTFNTYAKTALHDVAGAVAGLGDLLTEQPRRSEPRQMKATGTDGKPDLNPNGVHQDVHKHQARGGSKRHDPALSVVCDDPRPKGLDDSKPLETKAKTKRRARDSNPQPITRHLISSPLKTWIPSGNRM